MSEADKSEGEKEAGAHPVPVSSSKGRPAFSKITRELSEKELASSGVQRMLIEELERLQNQVEIIGPLRERLYDAEKDREVLRQRLRVAVAADIIFGGCLSIGSALVSVAPAIWDKQPYAAIILVTGTVLLVAAIVAKVVRT